MLRLLYKSIASRRYVSLPRQHNRTNGWRTDTRPSETDLENWEQIGLMAFMEVRTVMPLEAADRTYGFYEF
ncbi:hypothetical protein EGK75_12900 [Neisseria weixii]|uniref:Uncharacterized protein n=1 Tax=Neisseria weixii TaxID=1853276 RepID=A0A3N4MI03_9NEIS|nr:hypothetical protein EGK74_12840 [Neisseria weixii]RPD83705.1 hypothetical protein EGK75_12900 [Neisseria weixii]